MGGRHWNTDEINVVKARYGKEKTVNLVKELGRSQSSILSMAHRLGIHADYRLTHSENHRDRRKHTYNAERLVENSTHSNYWLGFIAADGCVSNNYNTNVISLGLHVKDIDRLEGLLNFIELEKDVNILTADQTKCYTRFTITSNLAGLLRDKYNMTPVKSLTLQPPNITDPELIKAFIVGYIDGDGCIRVCKRDKLLRIQIRGTFDFLSWVKSYFDLWVPPAKQSKVSTADGYGYYQVSGKRAVALCKILLEVPVDKMKRKWSLAESFVHGTFNLGDLTI